MSQKRDYDSTVARIAGNLLSGVLERDDFYQAGVIGMGESVQTMAIGAVLIARAIVASTRYTEPKTDGSLGDQG